MLATLMNRMPRLSTPFNLKKKNQKIIVLLYFILLVQNFTEVKLLVLFEILKRDGMVFTLSKFLVWWVVIEYGKWAVLSLEYAFFYVDMLLLFTFPRTHSIPMEDCSSVVYRMPGIPNSPFQKANHTFVLYQKQWRSQDSLMGFKIWRSKHTKKPRGFNIYCIYIKSNFNLVYTI